MNKLYISLSLALISSVLSIFALRAESAPTTASEKTASNDPVVMYYGNTCPHCKNVEKFLEENPVITEKTQIKLKEVYDDVANREELVERANTCGLKTDSIAVPFLWDNGECILGDEPIINRLKDK